MRTFLQKLATGRNVSILSVLALIMTFGVMPYLTNQMKALTDTGVPLDLVIPTYSPEFAQEMVAAYGAEGRMFYRRIALGADMVYPVIYGLAFVFLLFYLWTRVAPETLWLRWLILIPISSVIFDFSENLAIARLLDIFPDESHGMARLAGFFSLMKWSLAFLSLALIFTGLNGLLIRWLQSR